MEGLPGLHLLEGVIADTVLRALTWDDLGGLSPCDGRLAQLLAGSSYWLHAAIGEVPFLRLEAPCFMVADRTSVTRALRVVRKAVPARGLKASIGSAGLVRELAAAVRAASVASALHVRSCGGFGAPVIGLLRWKDEAALLGALSPPEPKASEFCLSAPISLPQRDSERLARLLGLGVAAHGPPLSMRIVFAWRDGQLMVAVAMGGLLPERLRLPGPTSRCATKIAVRVTLKCLDPELPLPETPLEISIGRQWVAVPLKLPEAADGRAQVVAAMVRGALCVATVTDLEAQRPSTSSVNILHLHPLRDASAA